jgi:hypothetical protein
MGFPIGSSATVTEIEQPAAEAAAVPLQLTVNGKQQQLTLDPRTTLDIRDTKLDSMDARGIGEIGITGTGAAIANAIFHATGKRVRDLPITPDKLI